MNRFAIPEPTIATLEHVNLRDEKHGEDTVPAIDIKLTFALRNDVLSLFDSQLKKWMYYKSKKQAPRADQGALDLDEPNDLPDLRFPQLDALRWRDDLEGCTLTIEYGIGGKSSLRLTDCKVNGFRLECLEGGTVRVTLRVQRSQPDERTVGKLSGLLKREVHLTLTQSPATEALLAEQPEGDAIPFDATDAFLSQHGQAAQDGAAPAP